MKKLIKTMIMSLTLLIGLSMILFSIGSLISNQNENAWRSIRKETSKADMTVKEEPAQKKLAIKTQTPKEFTDEELALQKDEWIKVRGKSLLKEGVKLYFTDGKNYWGTVVEIGKRYHPYNRKDESAVLIYFPDSGNKVWHFVNSLTTGYLCVKSDDPALNDY